MGSSFRCPECGAPNRLLETLNHTVLDVAREVRLGAVLQRMADSARELVGARVAAVAVADETGAVSEWVASGVAAKAMPQPGGLFEAVLESREVLAANDVRRHPRFDGWPDGYPDLASFLGVPIVADGGVAGAFYLANEDTWGFTSDDRRIIELIVPHAALAIRNAKLHDRSRELTVLQERNRLARELHDSVTQSLFSMRLAATTAVAGIEHDPASAAAQMERVRELAGTALAEMRALISELRPPELDAEGLVALLDRHVQVLQHVHDLDIRLHAHDVGDLEADAEAELFRLAQEALANALKHARARSVDVRLEPGEGGGVRLTVSDDGTGFDLGQARTGRGFGLSTMRERAEAVGARLTIDSAPGAGTTVTAQLGPGDRTRVP